MRPDLGPERGLDRRLLRTPERDEEQGLVRVKEQNLEQMLFRVTGQEPERRPLRRPEPVPERGPRWMSLREPEQTLQRALERGPVWGQEFPQPSRGWENGVAGEVRSQKLDARSQKWRRAQVRR
jgi:hypothetical protein